jgi:hypothetical protein
MSQPLDGLAADQLNEGAPMTSWRRQRMRREQHNMFYGGRIGPCRHEDVARTTPPGHFDFCPYCGEVIRGRERPLRHSNEERALFAVIFIMIVLAAIYYL